MPKSFFVFKPIRVCASCLLVTAGAMYGGPVLAQQCSITREMVTQLYHPDPGSYTVWDAVYGEGQKSEVFTTVMPKGKGVVAAGTMQALEGVRPSLMLVGFDRRGRETWNQYVALSGLRDVVKILPHGKEGYLVLANRKKQGENASVWLGVFDHEGTLKSHRNIQDDKFDLLATDIVAAPAGSETKWYMAVTNTRKAGVGENETVFKNATIYRLGENRNELSSRAYVLGSNNEILGLAVSKFEGENYGLIATGYFENKFGKKNGWLMRLTEEASLAWQTEYSRGLSAKLKYGTGYKGKDIIAFGDVRPADSGPIGSWAMRLDGNNGRLIWQRYYYGETGHHDYQSRGLFVNKDGLITLMMAAEEDLDKEEEASLSPAEESTVVDDKMIPEEMSYAHVLSLSPRGVTLNGDSYYQGQGVSVSQMVEGHGGERLIAGFARMPAQDVLRQSSDKTKPENPPLKEPGSIDLPDAQMSEATKAGLEMLKNRLGREAEKKSGKQRVKTLPVNSESANQSLTRDGWIAVGAAPETYTDPCVRVIKGLP